MMSDQYVGEIRMFAGQQVPHGWMYCDGAKLNIVDYQVLYALIGTSYGGDGVTTFQLPDLRGRLPIHQGLQPIEGINYPLASANGTETVTLSTTQMPLHTHGVMTVSGTDKATTDSPTNAFPATSTINSYGSYDASTIKAMNAASVSVAGNSMPHNNMMPFLAISFIISVNGIYPSPN